MSSESIDEVIANINNVDQTIPARHGLVELLTA